MAAVANTTYVRKFTFKTILDELSNKEKEAEEQIIIMLHKYSSSLFHEDSWILDKKSNKSHPDTLAFMNTFSLHGNKGKHLAKLFAVITISRGNSVALHQGLRTYFKYLHTIDSNLLQIKKAIFANYIYWLDEQRKNNGELFSESYKHTLLNSALKFHTLMNGHTSIAFINGIEAIENPYDKKTKDSKYEVIQNNILEKLDNIFNQDESPLHMRVAYWIMRLFATRPDDTFNYPLDCVKKITDNMVTIKHAILKNSKNSGNLDYKFGFLNLNEPVQRMLIDLIEKQQYSSLQLQDKATKKEYLFTYQHAVNKKIYYLSSQSFYNHFIDVQRICGIPKAQQVIPRDLKKTGITLRTEFGWTSPQLKQFANHQTYNSIDAYSEPSVEFIIKEQRKILESSKELSNQYVFKGKIIHKLNDEMQYKILTNPRAHKIANLGFCPDIRSCGHHLECLDCKDLIPDYDLKDYYLEQADRYLKISEKQFTINDKTNARDSYHRATLFAALYNKVNNGEAK